MQGALFRQHLGDEGYSVGTRLNDCGLEIADYHIADWGLPIADWHATKRKTTIASRHFTNAIPSVVGPRRRSRSSVSCRPSLFLASPNLRDRMEFPGGCAPIRSPAGCGVFR